MNHGRDDLERQARIQAIKHMRAINQSPWSIGVSHWNQRDLYTRNSRVEDDGYGRGPSVHPAEGSYAYHREPQPHDRPRRDTGATLHEREAWPWLNYLSAEEDPYFAHLDHARGAGRGAAGSAGSLWERLKDGVDHLFHIDTRGGTSETAPKNAGRLDARVHDDVCDALTFRGDLDATDIVVTVHAGEVTLDGTVTDRHSKRIAEEVAEGVIGVRDVHNRLTIRKDDPTDANVVFVLPVALFGV